MNVQETLAIIEALRLAGVTHFKSPYLEISFGPVPRGTAQVKQPQAELSPEQAKATESATQQIKNMINTINMSPEELANKIFPDGAL